MGPWLVTADELARPREQVLTLEVDGEQCQHGNTADMIFGVDEIVSYCSRFMTPKPGDLISAGTSAGVGLGMRPPQYLKDGDVVDMRITGLGTQRHKDALAGPGLRPRRCSPHAARPERGKHFLKGTGA